MYQRGNQSHYSSFTPEIRGSDRQLPTYFHLRKSKRFGAHQLMTPSEARSIRCVAEATRISMRHRIRCVTKATRIRCVVGQPERRRHRCIPVVVPRPKTVWYGRLALVRLIPITQMNMCICEYCPLWRDRPLDRSRQSHRPHGFLLAGPDFRP